MEKRRNRLTPAGRRACAAAGARNLEAWLASQESPLDVRDEVTKFEAELLADLGGNVNAARRGLAASAAASYAVVLIARNKLLRVRRWRHGTDSLVDLLSRAQGQFLRSLKGLGVDLHDAGDPADDAPTIAELQAEYAEKHRREAEAAKEARSADDSRSDV